MKNFKKYFLILVSILAFVGCQDDDTTFGDINSPSGLVVDADIVGQDEGENPNGDGSGFVDFTAKANDAISYKYIFSDGDVKVSPNGILRKRFTKNGTNVYTVTVIANGTAGVSSSISFEITVFSNFTDPEVVTFLTGGSSKKWYFSASEVAHLGVGPNNSDAEKNFYSDYYSAQPFEKAASPASSCLYDNELTFSLDGEILKYQLNNGGKTFVNASYLPDFGASGPDDQCLDNNTSGLKTVILSPSESILMTTNREKTRGTAMTFSDGGFMGYYIGQSTYEILTITENRMVVRAVMGNNPALAWYHIFTTTKPVQASEPVYTNLVWSDEFDVNGAPNTANWSYDIGAGGWGNGELQYYTDSNQNIKVEGGLLKITPKRQNFSGSQYTSSRIISKDKKEFKYGKFEIKAKMPTGVGTWPAIWMLGANYDEVGWPNSGEIDILEYRGVDPNKALGTLHYPGHSGGNGPTASTPVPNAETQFHIYSLTWSATSIKFAVDGNVFHTFTNNASTPFNADFFFILNVAMGGTLGGDVDPAFTQSTMEVDYVRVYQ